MIPISNTRVTFSPAIQLDLRVSGGPPGRTVIIAPEGVNVPALTRTKAFESLPLYVQLDGQKRLVRAYLSPIPNPLVLYRAEDFAAVAGDSLAEHAERVEEILGEQAEEILQRLLSEPYTEEDWIPAKPRIPRSIESWRAKVALSAAGLLPKVAEIIGALPEPQRTVVSEAWSGAAPLTRRGATVAAMGEALGMSAGEIDELFIRAAAIEI